MHNYTKYVVSGNDFLVIDPNFCDVAMTPENIKLICDRHLGIGADGILYGPFKEVDGFGVRVFNPDATECGKSGNGLRIFARYLHEMDYVKDRDFVIFTREGPNPVSLLDLRTGEVKVSLGEISFSSDCIPVSGPVRQVVNEELSIEGELLTMTCASIGTPHCVVPVNAATKTRILQLGPLIANNALFPQRINVELLQIIDKATVSIEIWERGAGYTLASGACSCAAAGVAWALGMVGPRVTVHMPGGMNLVEIDSGGGIHLTGTSQAVANGLFADDFHRHLTSKTDGSSHALFKPVHTWTSKGKQNFSKIS